ncbi:MAG: hypothetical protein J1G30_01245 [Spirochaetales bacterium]|nr:hypothetical protein [Spirochaetales bacterium]
MNEKQKNEYREKLDDVGYSNQAVKEIADKIIEKIIERDNAKYIPFGDGDEFISQYQAIFSYHHGIPPMWVMGESGDYYMITQIHRDGCCIAGHGFVSYSDLAARYFFPLATLTPVAVRIKEVL